MVRREFFQRDHIKYFFGACWNDIFNCSVYFRKPPVFPLRCDLIANRIHARYLCLFPWILPMRCCDAISSLSQITSTSCYLHYALCFLPNVILQCDSITNRNSHPYVCAPFFSSANAMLQCDSNHKSQISPSSNRSQPSYWNQGSMYGPTP